MAKRRVAVIIFLLCLCLFWLPCNAQAISTADAKEPISPDEDCSLTIAYRYDGKNFSNYPVKLYKIADVSADFQYTLTAPFANSGLILNGVQSAGEWNVIRSTLETHILTDDVVPIKTVETDASGQTIFTQLTPGLYLASAVEAEQDNLTCFFDSALVALPGLGTDGLWQYQVAVAAKPQVLPPIQPDEEMQLKVLKLWKGDEGRTDRPKSIEVEIFRDGVSYETVILSENNNWSYSWSALADGASWKVAERNVPAGYTMLVEQRDSTFLITNSRESHTDPLPQTGDTSNILLYTIMMYISGAMLIVLGVVGKRKRHEETN